MKYCVPVMLLLWPLALIAQPTAAPGQPSAFMQFVPLITISLVFGFIARRLAQDKGRDVTKWTIWGFIPGVNIVLMWYFVGAANQRAERKLDALLQAQGKDPASFR